MIRTESNVSGNAVNNKTRLEQEIDKTFSQSWSIYRIATHPLGGLALAAEMDWKYSTRQMLQMIEMLDIHDDLEKQAIEKAKANKSKPK